MSAKHARTLQGQNKKIHTGYRLAVVECEYSILQVSWIVQFNIIPARGTAFFNDLSLLLNRSFIHLPEAEVIKSCHR